MRWILVSVLGLACLTGLTARTHAEAPADSGQPATENREPLKRWEVSLDGRVGFPTGYIKVSETNAPGTKLNLRNDLGLDVSEAGGGSAAFHFTSRDAVRVSALYYFLSGSSTIDRPFTYNSQPFEAGHVHSKLDYYRLSLSYERRLLDFADGASLTGSVGVTYVNLDAVVHGNAEDFYRQELP